MPNYCDYEMKIVGKKNNVDAFLRKLRDYDEVNHFWRIFEADVSYDKTIKDVTTVIVGGNCAWSIESCCRASGYSEGVDLFAVNTKDLHLTVEVWSREEEGMFFEEHYIYKFGKCLVEETEKITEPVPNWDRYTYDTFEEFADDYLGGIEGCPYKETDFDEDGDYIGNYDKGGFPNWGEYTI